MVEGKNVVGRPTLSYLQQTMEDVNVPKYRQMIRKAENREKCR